MTHELKILPKYFDAVNCGLKNFEIRINDRNYQEDDELILKEWERGKYTGRECRRWVGYIYHGDGTYGIAENTVVMALKRSAPMKSIDEEGSEEGFIGTLKQLLDKQPTVNQWIPCSERLPENDDDVLVQMNDGSMMVDFIAASSNGWFWAELGDEPVAWMPLPSPYQEGADNDRA